MGTPTSSLHLNLITSQRLHLLILSHWGLQLQKWELWAPTSIQSITLGTCSSFKLKSSRLKPNLISPLKPSLNPLTSIVPLQDLLNISILALYCTSLLRCLSLPLDHCCQHSVLESSINSILAGQDELIPILSLAES